MELLIGLAALILFDLAALRWATGNQDGPESDEWQRRHQWPAFGGGRNR